MSVDESDLSDSELNQIEPDSDGYISEESIPQDQDTKMSVDESDLSDSELNQIEPDSDGYTSEESIPPDESTDEGKSAFAL